MSKSPLDLIDHILVEVSFLKQTRQGLTQEIFSQDALRQRAFTRSLEIIGEAVKNFTKQYPHIEWKAIAGMRDKLIHHYFGVDYSLVWDIVENKIDTLQIDLEQIKATLEH